MYEPDDRFDVIEPLTVMAERYEDVPDERERIGAEITAFLQEYLTCVRWPLAAPR